MKLIQNRNKDPGKVSNTQIKVQIIFHHFKTADDDDDGNDKAELLAISFLPQWGKKDNTPLESAWHTKTRWQSEARTHEASC